MPLNDITFCNNKDCEIKKDCKRYLSSKRADNYVNPVSHFVPQYDESGVRCEMFMKKESKQ